MEEIFNQYGWRVTLESADLPDGRVKHAARVHRSDAVSVLAFPTASTLLIIREYRPFFGTYVWMLPTGKVDKETDILVAAQRELQEETGFAARDLSFYCTTNQAEGITIANHIFKARDLYPSPLPQDDHELIEAHELPIELALENILSSPFTHTSSAFALLKYAREAGI